MRPLRDRTWAQGLMLTALLLATPVGAAQAGPILAQPGQPAGNGNVQRLAGWVVRSGDARSRPFIIIDKAKARVFAYHADGTLAGDTPALLGVAHGDVSPPGIGSRKLADIGPAERITPAGRFEAAMGRDLTNDVLWIDYDAAISLHRVVTTNAAEHRLARLATASLTDKRISFGCINVPAAFYEKTVAPLFRPADGVVYILPEQSQFASVFAAAAGSPTLAMADGITKVVARDSMPSRDGPRRSTGF